MTATLLSSPHRISFLIQRGIILAMASRRFTVDPVKKKEFINIFLLMPETRVDDAMRKAEFTEKDIADLLLRRSLQRALPGGSITGLKDYIARQRKQPPPHLPVDPAATDAAATVPPPEEIVINAEATGSCQRRRRIRRGHGNRITAFLAQWRLACL